MLEAVSRRCFESYYTLAPAEIIVSEMSCYHLNSNIHPLEICFT
jgi:hypothetical protein